MMEQIDALYMERLTLSGFRQHKDEHSWDLGRVTTVTGHNRQGKSTIAEAIAFALAGAPYFGGKNLDALHNPDNPVLYVQLDIVTGKGAKHTIVRTRQNSRTSVSLDGAEITQARFAERFGSKDFILSVLNPLYFAETLGADGRKVLEDYLPVVLHETVLSKLSAHMREILGADSLLSPETYIKSMRDELRELEKDRLVLDGQMQQTEGQRDKLTAEIATRTSLLTQSKAALATLEVKRAQNSNHAALECEINQLSTAYDALDDTQMSERLIALRQQSEAICAQAFQSVRTEVICRLRAALTQKYEEHARESNQMNTLSPGTACPACHRTIDAQEAPRIYAFFMEQLNRIKAEGAGIHQQLDAQMAAEQQEMQQFESWKADALRQMDAELSAQAADGNISAQREVLKAQIKERTRQLLFGALTPEEESRFIKLSKECECLTTEITSLQSVLAGLPKGQQAALDVLDEKIRQTQDKITAARDYLSKRAELLFAPVQMERTGIRLFETLKESGEMRDVFKLTYDGRDYVQLSPSERVQCGLELVMMLTRLSGKHYPVFIDNSESICDFASFRPSGQMIVARVASHQPLCVTNCDATQRKAG